MLSSVTSKRKRRDEPGASTSSMREHSYLSLHACQYCRVGLTLLCVLLVSTAIYQTAVLVSGGCCCWLLDAWHYRCLPVITCTALLGTSLIGGWDFRVQYQGREYGLGDTHQAPSKVVADRFGQQASNQASQQHEQQHEQQQQQFISFFSGLSTLLLLLYVQQQEILAGTTVLRMIYTHLRSSDYTRTYQY